MHLRPVLCATALLTGCNRIAPPPADVLEPYAIISPETDTAWTEIPQMKIAGCSILGLDYGTGLLKPEAPDRSVRSFGRRGAGPGEFGMIRAFAVNPDSIIIAMDYRRRRLIEYYLNGTFRGDYPLQGGILRHAPMGRIAATRTRIVDYWFTDIVMGWYVPDSALGTLPLIQSLRLHGTAAPDEWGTPTDPPAGGAHQLAWMLQAGDIAIYRDTLFVLRHPDAVIEVFSLAHPSRSPVRSIRLRRFRRAPAPSEAGSRIVQSPKGGTRFSSPTALTYERQTSAFTIDSAGRFLVVSRLDDEVTAQQPWPSEVLAVYDHAGGFQAAFRLPTRGTSFPGMLSDGSLALLPLAATATATSRVELYRISGGKSERRSCGWSSVP